MKLKRARRQTQAKHMWCSFFARVRVSLNSRRLFRENLFCQSRKSENFNDSNRVCFDRKIIHFRLFCVSRSFDIGNLRKHLVCHKNYRSLSCPSSRVFLVCRSCLSMYFFYRFVRPRSQQRIEIAVCQTLMTSPRARSSQSIFPVITFNNSLVGC